MEVSLSCDDKPTTCSQLAVQCPFDPCCAFGRLICGFWTRATFNFLFPFHLLGRPCRRNQFLDRISNPILGSSTRASFAGRQQVASGFSQTRIAMMAETGEMVGASFLSICVTVGAASFGSPKARNLLSSALPFNVVAPLFFWWVWRQLAAHPTSELSQNPKPHGTAAKPTRSPPRTHPKPYLKQRRSPPPTHWCL